MRCVWLNRALDACFVSEVLTVLIGHKAYDSDPLDASLRGRGIEMVAPHKKNRKRPVTQDGRRLRRYKRRFKVERFFQLDRGFPAFSREVGIPCCELFRVCSSRLYTHVIKVFMRYTVQY